MSLRTRQCRSRPSPKSLAARLGLPVEPREREHFEWFAHFADTTMSASSARTREKLGWKPQGPSLLADPDQPGYYA